MVDNQYMIKTVFMFIYLAVSMIFLLPFGLLFTLIHFVGFGKLMKLVVYKIAQYWALLTIKLTGCKVTAKGRENIFKNGGVCFVSNHNGFFDIAVLLAYCGRPFGFVAKKELLYIPFLNYWIYMLGGLFIDRGKVRSAIKTINKGGERLKNGGGMLIFPEGHRSKGNGLLPFHAGSLKLATMANVPIIPVAIEGSYNVFEKSYRVVKSEVNITFCRPIETAGLSSEDKKAILCDRIYAVIKEQLTPVPGDPAPETSMS
jgi:1-acyl-sn-glycerol-3-phosphate acyltransferase